MPCHRQWSSKKYYVDRRDYIKVNHHRKEGYRGGGKWEMAARGRDSQFTEWRQWLSCLQIDIVSCVSASEVSDGTSDRENICDEYSDWSVMTDLVSASRCQLGHMLVFLVMSNHHVRQEAGEPDGYLHFAKLTGLTMVGMAILLERS